jgi:ABC-type multidrug transport system permease subunit
VTESALWQLTLSRLRAFIREPSALFWTFGFPVILTVALGVAFRNRPPDPVFVAVEERDGAAEVAAILGRTAEVRVEVVDATTADRRLFAGKVALIVSPGATRRFRFDPTRPESRLARTMIADLLEQAAGRRDPLEITLDPVTEPGSRYVDFLVPGLIGMTLMQSGMWGIGYVIVEMRTRRLMRRLVATPMRRSHFLFAFVLMRSLFLLAELPILLGFSWLCFSVGVRGSLATLLGLSLLGATTFAGIGLLVASRVQNTQAVGGLINLVTMPMFIGSGVFFSAERFPDLVQPLLAILPLTALNDALRAVMLDGAGVAQLGRPLLILAAWGVISFATATRIFRWR